MSEPPGKLEDILLQAISLNHADRTRETGELCRNILESAPDEPNSLHLLGVVYLMNGDSAKSLVNRANLYRGAGNLKQAGGSTAPMNVPSLATAFRI